jgi:hypothetical protein
MFFTVGSKTRTTDFPNIDHRQKTTQPSQRILLNLLNLVVHSCDSYWICVKLKAVGRLSGFFRSAVKRRKQKPKFRISVYGLYVSIYYSEGASLIK